MIYIWICRCFIWMLKNKTLRYQFKIFLLRQSDWCEDRYAFGPFITSILMILVVNWVFIGEYDYRLSTGKQVETVHFHWLYQLCWFISEIDKYDYRLSTGDRVGIIHLLCAGCHIIVYRFKDINEYLISVL